MGRHCAIVHGVVDVRSRAEMNGYAPALCGAARAARRAVAVGKAWSATNYADGRGSTAAAHVNRPALHPGLIFLVANQIDLAIEELGRAARSRR